MWEVHVADERALVCVCSYIFQESTGESQCDNTRAPSAAIGRATSCELLVQESTGDSEFHIPMAPRKSWTLIRSMHPKCVPVSCVENLLRDSGSIVIFLSYPTNVASQHIFVIFLKRVVNRGSYKLQPSMWVPQRYRNYCNLLPVRHAKTLSKKYCARTFPVLKHSGFLTNP